MFWLYSVVNRASLEVDRAQRKEGCDIASSRQQARVGNVDTADQAKAGAREFDLSSFIVSSPSFTLSRPISTTPDTRVDGVTSGILPQGGPKDALIELVNT